MLITLGSIFLVGQFVPAWGIGKTWPLLLVAIGVTKLFESFF
jgi:LiaI-LiaF-like transmembrane region